MLNLEEGTELLILWIGWAIHDFYLGRWRLALGWLLSSVTIAIIILATWVFV